MDLTSVNHFAFFFVCVCFFFFFFFYTVKVVDFFEKILIKWGKTEKCWNPKSQTGQIGHEQISKKWIIWLIYFSQIFFPFVFELHQNLNHSDPLSLFMS